MQQVTLRRCFIALVALITVLLAAATPVVGQNETDGNGQGTTGGQEQQGAQGNELTITGHDGDGGEYWFEVEGMEGRNPTITLEPGTEYTVNFENVGDQVHNVHFGEPIDEATELIFGGETDTLTFTVPDDASGTAEYWCDPHRDLGMVGELQYGSTDGGGAGDGNGTQNGGDGGEPQESQNDGIPGFGGLIAIAAVAIAVVLGVAAGRRHR